MNMDTGECVVVRGTGDVTDAFLPPYGPLAQIVVDTALQETLGA